MNKPIYLGMSILVLAQPLCMNFGMITLNQNIKTEKLCYMDADGFVFILKLKIFTKASLMTLKNGLTHQTTAKMIIDCFRQVGMKNKNRLFKDELGGKIMKEFVGLRAKTWAYLLDDDSEHKKAKGTEKKKKKRNKKRTYV